jgi:deoxycytidine triphosphate deaminase
MILGYDEVIKLGLVKNLCKREIENPEGCGIDVRIGKIHEISEGRGFLGIEERKTPTYELVASYEEGKKKVLSLKPGRIYIGETIEEIDTPKNIFGRFYPRHTLFKNGILVLGQKTDPGYKGKFSFVMINLSDREFKLELGSRIAMFVFHEIRGRTFSYRGQWKGGRAFIERKEKQV